MNTPGNFDDNKLLIIITPVVLYSFLILSGVLGVDFGHHWDEWFFISQATHAIDKGVLLPTQYDYPSFLYFVVLAAEAIYKAVFQIENVTILNTDHNFNIYLRVIFLLISSLTVVWVYWLTLKVSKNYLAALIAGLIILSSFEFSYHSRWAVTDTIAVQFTILSALFLFFNLSRNKRIILSSLIAGIAAGTKYTAAIICLNIIFFIILDLRFNKENLFKRTKELFLFVSVFLIVFIITTPGVILDNKIFMQYVMLKKDQYSGGHAGHTVQSGLSHFSKISDYIIFELFSKNYIVSFLIFLFSLTGFAWALLKKKWMLSGLLVTMAIYIFYISSFQVMIVRNLLYVFPFFTVFAALGLNLIITLSQNKKIKFALSSIIIITLFYSCSIVFSSSLTIINKSGINFSEELKSYLIQNSDKHFVFSYNVLPLVRPEYKNMMPSEDSYLVFYMKEVPFTIYTANIRNQFIKVIGMEDVNFNYYPTWMGSNRIVIMKYRDASEDLLDYTLRDEEFAFPDSLSGNIRNMKITFLPEGIYSPSYSGQVTRRKLKAYIANSKPPFNYIDSSKAKLDTVKLTSTLSFSRIPPENSYLVLKHGKSLESWNIPADINSNRDTVNYILNVSESTSYSDHKISANDTNLVFTAFGGGFDGSNLNDMISLNNSDEFSKMFKP